MGYVKTTEKKGGRGREDSLEDGVVIGKKEGVGSRVLGVLNWTKGILIVRRTRYYNTLSERGKGNKRGFVCC